MLNAVDMHCDTISRLLKKNHLGEEESLRVNSGHLDSKRLKQAGYRMQCFALFVNMAACEKPFEEYVRLYELYQKEMKENSEILSPVLCYEDILRNTQEGRISAMLTVEEGGVCEGSLDKLREIYDMGVRMMTLTWNHKNQIGEPNLDFYKGKEIKGMSEESRWQAFEPYFYTPNTHGGLTSLGREFVREMEKLGMIIDVSHLSDAGFFDVLRETTKPFVASHSNARSICPCVRNLTDEMIRQLSERGGCMGLNFCADFLKAPVYGENSPGGIEDVVKHAKHIVNVGGISVLGIGSDFDGIDTNPQLEGVQSMEFLYDALHKGGFSATQLEMIFEKNVLRVCKDVL